MSHFSAYLAASPRVLPTTIYPYFQRRWGFRPPPAGYADSAAVPVESVAEVNGLRRGAHPVGRGLAGETEHRSFRAGVGGLSLRQGSGCGHGARHRLRLDLVLALLDRQPSSVVRPQFHVAPSGGRRLEVPDPSVGQDSVVDRPHRLEVTTAEPVDGGHHQDVSSGEPLVQQVPLGTGTFRSGASDRDIGIGPPGLNAGVGELAALHPRVTAGVPGLLVPPGADVAVGCHMPILPFPARGSQEATVSISTTGVKRAFLATRYGSTPVPSHSPPTDLTTLVSGVCLNWPSNG